MALKVAVVGGGSWGTTVAHIAAHNTPTTVWARDSEVVDEINTSHTHSRYLEGYQLHPDLKASNDLAEVVGAADVVVMGVPSHCFRETAIDVAKSIRPWVPVVSLTKGLEQGTAKRMSQVLAEELGNQPVAVLTGPNLAKEILAGHAAAAVIATGDIRIARALQPIFSSEMFRVYTNPDVIGCELGGVLKNVIAVASGMADGLGTGDNTRAAVITRGLNEITQLGVALGGEALTFSGLAGMGDLMATCISKQSRNRHVGEELGKGRTLEEIIEEMHMVAEGVKSVDTVLALAAEHGVAMPIATEVQRVVNGEATAAEAYRGLLRRDIGRELDGQSF